MTFESSTAPCDWTLQAHAVLDEASANWEQLGPEHALVGLSVDLDRLRLASGDAWPNTVVPAVRNHSVTRRMREHTPIVRHAASWPRGYPGDAGLIDQLYGACDESVQLSDEWRRANAIVRQCEMARSVRHRRLVIADAIDNCASVHSRPDILSVACGHAREVEWSHTMADGLVNRFVAADQDRQSLDEIARRLGDRFPVVEPLHLSVRGILAGRAAALGQFHLVYAAGLYDYLPEALARSLTARLFQLLQPGGRLLLGNFSRSQDIGFMESIMDWSLIWRSEGEMVGLADAIPAADIAQKSVWADATSTCLYLDLVRI